MSSAHINNTYNTACYNSHSKNTAIQTFYEGTLGLGALTAVKLTGVTVCGHALSHLCVSFKLQACR